ncbi:uncharacterized protein LOC115978380 [Quercus lobata]|uniref:uncharacterized protein LOC115978380 n=1 Tax=Quercus lobata TaxID=97700 RepID=UPI0012476A80|nr:uncharacterized protein LOC115978380 [Quercus lobata]
MRPLTLESVFIYSSSLSHLPHPKNLKEKKSLRMCEARLCNMKEGKAFSTLEKDWAIKSKDWWFKCGWGTGGGIKNFRALSQRVIFGGSWKRTRLFWNGRISKEGTISKEGGVTLREHFKLVGPYTALPSIGNSVMIVTSYRVINISQVGR